MKKRQIEEEDFTLKQNPHRPDPELPAKKKKLTKKQQKELQSKNMPSAKPKIRENFEVVSPFGQIPKKVQTQIKEFEDLLETGVAPSRPIPRIVPQIVDPPTKTVPPVNAPKLKKLKKGATGVKPKPKFLKKGDKGYFRINRCSVFLTVPQYKGTLTKEEVLKAIVDFSETKYQRKVVQCIVALENHGKVENPEISEAEGLVDPGVHWHIVFKVDKNWDIRRPDFFDPIFGQHCHIETVKAFNACVLYTAKDGNYTALGIDVDAIKKAVKEHKGVKHIEVANTILADPNVPISKLLNQFPGYMIQHQKKVIDFSALAQSVTTNLIPYYGIEDTRNCNLATQLIAKWLTENLPPAKRQHKQKQLYIYGPTNIGKTSLLMRLMDSFHTYVVADEEKFWSGFHDNYELAIIDEFNGCKTISQLNSFLEGTRVPLSQKGVTGVMKTKNIPVIICSNKSPREVYHHVNDKSPLVLDAFEARLEIIYTEDQIRVPFKKDILEGSQVDSLFHLLDEQQENSEDSLLHLSSDLESTVLVEGELPRDRGLDQMDAILDQCTPPDTQAPANLMAQLHCDEYLNMSDSYSSEDSYDDHSDISNLEKKRKRKHKK